jgi:hypothetical protein
MYPASRSDLKNIVRWLGGRDESQWEEQTRVLSDTIAILKELSRPMPRLDRQPSQHRGPDLLLPGTARINDAMPYLRGMLTAMRGRSRQDALDYGEAAFALLPEG